MKPVTVEEINPNSLGLAVKLVSATPNPQTVSYAAMHGDYSEMPLSGDMGPHFNMDPFNPGILTEAEAGQRVIKKCLEHRHWGPLEHPQIVVSVEGFPHTTMQQLRTHRTGVSFDVQSGRYTGQRIQGLAQALDNLSPLDADPVNLYRLISEVFYIRPSGYYRDRFSSGILFDSQDPVHLRFLAHAAKSYTEAVVMGMQPEMARDLYCPYGIRQNFLFSGNLRAILHILEMRSQKNAELECQIFSKLMIELLKEWTPEITNFWLNTRYSKNNIAP